MVVMVSAVAKDRNIKWTRRTFELHPENIDALEDIRIRRHLRSATEALAFAIRLASEIEGRKIYVHEPAEDGTMILKELVFI